MCVEKPGGGGGGGRLYLSLESFPVACGVVPVKSSAGQHIIGTSTALIVPTPAPYTNRSLAFDLTA